MKTKMLFNFFFIVLVIGISDVNAQSNFQGKAVYVSKKSMNRNYRGGQMSEVERKRMVKMLKRVFEKNYTLTFNKFESSYKQNQQLAKPSQGGGLRNMMSATKEVKYKNTRDSVFLEEKELFGKKFLIVDESKKPNWELSGETKK